MALSDLWLTARDQLSDKLVKQIISFAGSGQLRDSNDASSEFREYLSRVPSAFLARYADECLRESFEGSGFALQDIVNQVGKRLGFSITYGRYRGVQAQIGFDGLWRFPSGHAVIVEVKTTDTYRINLDSVANYRRALINQGDCLEDKSSILFIVGREDTGGLEAQIRGSRHAWDIRLISIDALLRLLALKEEVEDLRIIEKICAVLIPREFTRVDSIVDIVFSTAEDVRQEEVIAELEEQEGDEESDVEGRQRVTPVNFHEACITRIEKHLEQSLIKHSRTSYSSPDGNIALTCAVSKEYVRHGQQSYWFAFHPNQKEHLEVSKRALVAFGCGSEQTIILIPYVDFNSWLSSMNMTSGKDRFYWHVSISREGEQLILHRRAGFERINLTGYLLRAN
ncbi:MAG: hypothetical protein QOG00_2687 [Pyrinomonadaceae bacterium]|nr:hypothetical protein [Pyrinomonadaceae bacterium]